MNFNTLAFGGLALGCLVAGAGGGYLAARQAAPVDAPAIHGSAAAAVGPESSDTGVSAPVSESEGVITSEPAPVELDVPAAAPKAEPAAKTPPPTRSRSQAPERTARAAAAPPSRARTASAPTTSAQPARDSSRADSASSAAATSGPSSTPANAPRPAAIGGMWETRPTVTPEPAPAAELPVEDAAPAEPEFQEVVVPADAVLGLQIDRTVSSETARVEDRVDARVTRDVRVGDKVAIPAGSVVQGSVMEVERGGKVKERARLGIRFHTVVLSNGTRLAIKTDSVVREGVSPAKESAAKIGGAAIGGAILGAILGGGKGAVIGGATGAAGGTAATMAGDRNPAVLNAGSTVSVRMQQAVTVTVEKN